MKALITLVIASLVFASCSDTTSASERVKARLHEVNSLEGITVKYIDTIYHVGDTTKLLCADGSYHYFAILSK